MKRVFFNKKGGVGKSSLAVNLAAISAQRGYKTLVIDLDTQCNATQYLLDGKEDVSPNIADYFEQTITFHIHRKSIRDYVHSTCFDNLFIIPSSPELTFLETKLESRHKIYKLRDSLEEMASVFDRIYIDTAPALNFYSLSALIAADSCVIPIDCDDFSRKALYNITNHLEEIKEDHNTGLKIEGIVANQFIKRALLPKRIIDELKEESYPVFEQTISASVKMRESHQEKKPLIHMAPKHTLTEELSQLFNELEPA